MISKLTPVAAKTAWLPPWEMDSSTARIRDEVDWLVQAEPSFPVLSRRSFERMGLDRTESIYRPAEGSSNLSNVWISEEIDALSAASAELHRRESVRQPDDQWAIALANLR